MVLFLTSPFRINVMYLYDIELKRKLRKRLIISFVRNNVTDI